MVYNRINFVNTASSHPLPQRAAGLHRIVNTYLNLFYTK